MPRSPSRRCPPRRTASVAIEHPFLGTLELIAGAGPDGAEPDAAVLRERDQHGRGCTAPRRSRRTRRTASTTTSSAARRPSIPSEPGTKCAFWYRLTVPAGRDRRAAAAAAPGGHGEERAVALGAGFDAGDGPAAGRGRRVLRRAHPGRRQRRRGAGACARRSPGCCGASSCSTTTSPAGWTATPPSRRRRSRADRAERPVAQLRRVRHHVDAGQVGVSLVRGLGPGLPLRGAGARGPGVRQVPADPALPGVVPAPERGAARLRVGLRRRQPAGAGLGGAARSSPSTAAATSTSSAGSSTSCWSTSPGG